jgi:hypothetical protein
MISFHHLRTERIKELPDRLVRYDSPLLDVTASELRDYLAALVNALFLKASKADDLFDAGTARQVLQDQKRLQSLLGVAESALGTHNLKYPNANVGQGAVFAQPVAGSTVPNAWVSSRTVNVVRTLGGAGNAAWAAEIRFLCAEFRLDGQHTRMADVLASREGLVWETLKGLGLQQADADPIGAVLHNRLTQPDKGAIDRLSKQVFFPVRDAKETQYAVITPVQSFGLAREFHVRYRQRTHKDNPHREFFNTRALKVGGANPINAGPYNAELGGLYQHLLAKMPSQTADNVERLLARLHTQKSIFPRPKQLHLDVTDLVFHKNSLHLTQNSKTHRDNFEAAADSLALQLLQDAITLHQWLLEQAESPLMDAIYANIPDLQKQWLDPKLRQNPRLGNNQITALVAIAMRLLGDCPKHVYEQNPKDKTVKRIPAPLLGDLESKLMRDSLTALIKEF